MKIRFIQAVALSFALAFGLSIVTSQAEDKMADCVMMKGGKMVVTKSGDTTAMTTDMKLSNGSVVMMDGTVVMEDGKKVMMKDGQSITMDGKMVNADNMPGIHKD